MKLSNYIPQQGISQLSEENVKLISKIIDKDSVTNKQEAKTEKIEIENSKKTIVKLPDTLNGSELQRNIIESVGFSSETVLKDTLAYSVKIDLSIDKGYFHVKNGNVDSLYIILQYLTNLTKDNSPDSEFLYSYYSLYASYYRFKADFIKELEYQLKIKKILQPTQFEKLASVNQNIAIIYYKLLDFESSLMLYNKNLEIIKTNGSSYSLLFTYYGMADCHFVLGNQEDAKEICFKAIALNEKTGESRAFGFVYSLLGQIYIKENKIDSAEHYLNKGILISKNQNESKELYDNYNVMVKLQLLKKDTINAQFYAEKAIDNKIYHDPNLYNDLANIYSSQKKYTLANELFKKNIAYYRGVNDKDIAFSLASSLLKNRFEQEKTLQASQSKQKFQSTLLWVITVASILLLLLSSIIIFTQIVHRKKVQIINKRLIDKNENLEQFAYICSHDLKEPIRNIGSFTSLIQKKLKKEDLKLDYDEYFQIINGGTSMLTQIVNSLKIFTNLNRDGVISKSKISLNIAIKETIQSLSQLIQNNGVSISINNEIENQEIYSSKYGITLILINIIQNAIKHNQSKRRIVDISIEKVLSTGQK